MAPRSGRVNPTVQTRGAARSFVESLDTYYQPARDTRREQALQKGLGAFSQMFEQQAAEVQDQRRKDYYTQGQLDAIAEEAGQEMKGVQQKDILRQQSRYYTMGLEESRGERDAIKWKSEMAIQYGRLGMDAASDPEGFRAWLVEQSDDFLSQYEDRPHALRAAMPIIKQVTTNLSAQHAADIDRNLEREMLDAQDTRIFDIGEQLAAGDLTVDEALEAFNIVREDLFSTENARGNDYAVAGVIRAAVHHADPRLITTLLKNRKELGLTPTQMTTLADGLDAVEAEIDRRQSEIDDRERQRQAELEQQASTDLMTALHKNPNMDLYEYYLDWISKNNDGKPETWLFGKMQDLQSTYRTSRNNAQPASGEAQLSFRLEFNTAETPEERFAVIQKHAASLTPSQIDEALVEAGIVASPDGEGGYGEWQSDPINKERLRSFEDVATSVVTGFTSINKEEASKLVVQSRRVYTEAVERLARSNPNMSGSEIAREAAKEAGEFIWERADDAARDRILQDDAAIRMLGLTDTVTQLQQEAAEAAAKKEAEAEGMYGGDGTTTDAPEATEEPQEPTPLTGAERRALRRGEGGTGEGIELPEVEVDPGPRRGGRRDTGGADLSSANEVHEGYTAQPASFDPEELEEAPDPATMPEDEPYPEITDRWFAEQLARLTDGRDDREFGTITTADYQQVLTEDPQFAEAVVGLAFDLGTDPEALMAVMEFESGFSTTIRNAAGSGATGLIQFMPSTARSLGTTTDELAKMSRAEQMVYVGKYFKQFGDRLRGGSIDDVYMTVLYPAAVGKPDSYVLFSSPSTAYNQNSGLDSNGDGTITKYEAAAKVRARYNSRK